MLQAALGGGGLAYLSDHHVRDDVEAGRLVPVLEEWTPPYDGLCLYFPGRRHVPAKLRALIDLVRELRSGGPRAPAHTPHSPALKF